jgi:signal transduction histidine kinase
MQSWSLKLRLLTYAAFGISLVLGSTGVGFNWLYRKHVERFMLNNLNSHMDQLLGNVIVGDDGVVSVKSRLSDPRFSQPGGGLYWQIDVSGQDSLRSRSLWDETLVIPTPPETEDEDHAHDLTLPSGVGIFASEKMVVANNDAGLEKKLIVTVGIDREQVTSPASEFSRALLWGLGSTYAALLASTLALITLGLRPLQAVKKGLAVLQSGGSSVFDASHLPSEVAPLAEEINLLMAAREKQLIRARERASNLAHGLKTPLAVLQAISNDLKSRGLAESADAIGLNTSQMRDLVDRELTRSRMSDGAKAHRANFTEVAQKVIATMKKAPRGDILSWSLNAAPEQLIPMDSVDLMELLGNLLDNARKHASEMVRISHDGKSLTIEDDGPGVADLVLPDILKRGVRLDEKMPGSGIGLAIVSDLADVYGLTLSVRKSDLGGLAVDVGMPANQARSIALP